MNSDVFVYVILTANDRRIFSLEAVRCQEEVRFKDDIQDAAGGMYDSRQCSSAECPYLWTRFIRTVVNGNVVRTFLF